MNASILTWLTFLPAAGAVVVLLLPRRGRAPQVFSLLLTLFLFVLALHLPAHFNYHQQQGFQFELDLPWISNPAIHYHVGVDGLSMWLVVLVSFLAPLGVLISWRAIQDRTREFYALLLLQQTAMYGVFIALDLILYYAFWELSIVPLALLIGMYGRKNGRGAAIKFFLYAFIPSALLLVGMLWLYAQTGTFDLVQLQQQLHGWSTGAHATGLWLTSLAFLAGLRRQGTRVSAARLAARWHQRSTDSGRDDSGRQAGPLFPAALACRAVPHAGRAYCAADGGAGSHRHSVRSVDGLGADGFEATGSLRHA